MKFLPSYIFLFLLITITACYSDNDLAVESASDTGIAGSYARFLIANDFMYVVDETSIKTFDLSIPTSPEQVDQQPIGERIESIFRFEDKLFVGSGAGLFIYQIGANGIPEQLSSTAYFETFDTFGCDPVVADEQHAFVTLNSLEQVDRPCTGTVLVDVNELRIYDIEDLTNPYLIAVYPMQAPKGVGLDGETLFICDDAAGLKIFNVIDPLNIELIKQFDDFTAFDVIPLNGLLLVVGPDNIYQFDYTDLSDIKLVAEIPFGV